MSIWKNITSFFTKSKVENKPIKENLGASWNSPNGINYSFPPKDSLDAYGEHAFLYAALQRVTEDLAALPLQVVQGKGKNQKILDSHPVLDLLNNPNTESDGFLFRQQIALDLILSGNCYCLILGKGKTPQSIVRLHPQETKFSTNENGINGIVHTSFGQSVQYPINKVLWSRTPSYKKGPESMYGTGSVEPLYEDLKSDIHAMQLCSEASKNKRPDVLLSPLDPGDVWPKETRDQIVNSYRNMAKNGGAIALSGLAKIDMLNLSARDMEYTSARTFARESIGSALSCPPTILGIPAANYATALEQRKTYWSNQKMRAKRFDILFTKLVKLWDVNLRIQHSFDGVSALDDKDIKLERIKIHIQNGMKASDAYLYEGLGDAPIIDSVDTTNDIIDETEKNILIQYFEKNNNERKQKWLKLIEKRQKPAEIEFLDSTKQYLKKSKRLILKKFNQLKSKSIITIHGEPLSYFEKDIRLTGDLITLEEKTKLIDSTLQGVYEKNFNKVQQEELKSIYNKARKDLDKAPTDNELIIGNYLETLANQLMKTTIKETNKIINKGISNNLSVAEIKEQINQSKVFSEGRAKRIARTEATKCVNAANQSAMIFASDDGIPIQKEWISERDDDVRPAHQELDGQRINVNQSFVVPPGNEFAGESAMYPCEFGVEGLDVNCRCMVISDVDIIE